MSGVNSMESSSGLTDKLEAIYKNNANIDLKLIYPFNNRTLLKRVMDIILLCNCLYVRERSEHTSTHTPLAQNLYVYVNKGAACFDRLCLCEQGGSVF